MKKGFTMIELIFVIVILGILASVAIPRLAATREDAEISAAVANLRTLVSDATAYYTVKGTFGDGKNGNTATKWNEITNVPLKDAANKVAAGGGANNDGILTIGGQECIAVALRNKNGTTPAYIVIAKKGGATGVCAQVQNSEPLKAYFNSKVTGVNNNKPNIGFMAIGSSTSIYDEQTTPATPATPAQ